MGVMYAKRLVWANTQTAVLNKLKLNNELNWKTNEESIAIMSLGCDKGPNEHFSILGAECRMKACNAAEVEKKENHLR